MTTFIKPADQYTRQIDPVKAYVQQVSAYVATTKGISVEEATVLVKDIVRKNLHNPKLTHLHRKENGDREVSETTLLNYIYSNIKDDKILVPTFTTYLNAKEKKSILAEFIAENVKTRSVSKKIAQKAKAQGDMDLFIAKNNEQNNMKIYNNSLSGAFAQRACILFNETAHNTLTSITRSVTSLANANNEKIISGNRFYQNPPSTLTNIVYIASNADIPKIAAIVDKYHLHLPSTLDTIKCLKRSTDLYFQDEVYYQNKIAPYLDKLTPYHRAAICYIGDLYHLRQYNDTFIRDFINEMILPVENTDTSADVPDQIYAIGENILNYVHQIWFSSVKGYGKDYAAMHKAGVAASILATAKHVLSVLDKYRDFLQAFFVSDILPSNSNKLKFMRRRTVVLSDTDSTCFTLDEWVKWYAGSFSVTDKNIAVAGAVSFVCTETIKHILALLSANINVAPKDLHVLAMKNEFLWTVHMPTEVSKHYAAYTVMQEGNVFAEPELEVKGVHLKNSAVPKFIIKDTNELLEGVLKTVNDNKKIKLSDVLSHIKSIELMISDSIDRGEPVFLKKSSVKNKEAYVEDEYKSPYQRHQFWMGVFAPKYGEVAPPPYNTIKMPTTITSGTKLKAWVASLEDRELAGRLEQWLLKYAKKDLPTIYINMDYAQAYGIPKEMLGVIDKKRIILDITIQYRLILESLGLLIEKNRTITELFR